jgi:Trk K+ transport system NAD-binding subunit
VRGLHDHAIIVPFNSYAEEIAKSLAEQGIKSVIMAKSKKGLAKVMEKRLVGVVGDIDEPDSFTAAGIERAAYVIACDYDDMKNAIITITAKSKSRDVKVISLVNDASNADKMRILKVDAFVTPEIAAAGDIADSIVKNAFVRGYTKG